MANAGVLGNITPTRSPGSIPACSSSVATRAAAASNSAKVNCRSSQRSATRSGCGLSMRRDWRSGRSSGTSGDVLVLLLPVVIPATSHNNVAHTTAGLFGVTAHIRPCPGIGFPGIGDREPAASGAAQRSAHRRSSANSCWPAPRNWEKRWPICCAARSTRTATAASSRRTRCAESCVANVTFIFDSLVGNADDVMSRPRSKPAPLARSPVCRCRR